MTRARLQPTDDSISEERDRIKKRLRGWGRVSQELVKNELPRMTGNDWMVLTVILMRTVGFAPKRIPRRSTKISHDRFLALTGIKSRNTLSACIARLEKGRYIEVERRSRRDAMIYHLGPVVLAYIIPNFRELEKENDMDAIADAMKNRWAKGGKDGAASGRLTTGGKSGSGEVASAADSPSEPEENQGGAADDLQGESLENWLVGPNGAGPK